IGEALAGEGNEIAHIDLLIGSKTGPVGAAFASALANQSAGHNNLLAVLTPNLLVKPATILITKVTIKGMKQAVQMLRPAQYPVAGKKTETALHPREKPGVSQGSGPLVIGRPERALQDTTSASALPGSTPTLTVPRNGDDVSPPRR